MTNSSVQTKWQTRALVVLRFLIGWHMLYEGIYKLMDPNWSSIGFLGNARWVFSGIADWIISNDGVLSTVDFLNTWGLIAIGLGLVLGLFTKLASLSGVGLLLLYYLFNPPFIGMDTIVPMEGNYLFVNKTLIEAAALLLIALFPAARSYGLDSIIKIKLKK